jgi:hypothetical protein
VHRLVPAPTRPLPVRGPNDRLAARTASADVVAVQRLRGRGVISNWGGSPYVLCRRTLTLSSPVNEVVFSDEVAAALRDLQLLDTDCERLVFAMRTDNDRVILPATDDDLDELVGFVGAEANHEPSRRRQQRLDVALDAFTDAQTNLHDT